MFSRRDVEYVYDIYEMPINDGMVVPPSISYNNMEDSDIVCYHMIAIAS